MLTLKVYGAILPIFLAIDYIWLGVVMSKFYKNELGVLARVSNGSLTPVFWAAAIVYVLIPLGAVLFAPEFLRRIRFLRRCSGASYMVSFCTVFMT